MRRAPLLYGYALDLALGDPDRLHPVAGFGALAAAAERWLWAPRRGRGALVAGTLVALAAATAQVAHRLAATRSRVAGDVVFTLVAWTALGGRSLRREAAAVEARLRSGDLAAARHRLRSLCGRDAAALDETELRRAVVESLAENTSDAVTGALLWGALAGPAGVAGYRAANTLDAMFGHRTSRHREFGWAAARLDDLLNWPAARMSALLTCALAPLVGGSPRRAGAILRRDGAAHPSPNAGRVEAAFAGALGVRLGGALAYRGHVEQRPVLGDGPAPGARDVIRARRLSLAVASAAALACGVAR